MSNVEVITSHLAVVTELPQQSVLNQFRVISESLTQSKFTGTVVFDLLISKGFDGRFIQACFDGKSILRSSLKEIKNNDLPIELIDKQNGFFQNNFGLLSLSVLSSSEIKQFFE